MTRTDRKRPASDYPVCSHPSDVPTAKAVVLKRKPQEPAQLHSAGNGATVGNPCPYNYGRATAHARTLAKDQPRDEHTEGGTRE